MSDKIYNVLFLCTGNTARSVLAEGILRKDGAGRFNAFSAGSQPKGVVNPFALKVLGAYGYPVEGYRSKSWDEFAAPGAPVYVRVASYNSLGDGGWAHAAAPLPGGAQGTALNGGAYPARQGEIVGQGIEEATRQVGRRQRRHQ